MTNLKFVCLNIIHVYAPKMTFFKAEAERGSNTDKVGFYFAFLAKNTEVQKYLAATGRKPCFPSVILG